MTATAASTMMARSSQVRSTERREGVSMAEVVMDDMAIGNPVPYGPALALLGLIPRHPYSAVPFPSNWQLWRNFPDAMQQSRLVSSQAQTRCRTRIGGNRIRNCPLAMHTI